MNRPMDRLRTNWDVVCPTCGAEKQKPCSYRDGRPWFHVARRRAAASASGKSGGVS